jgi:DNA-binding SARP family transcriptional activator
MTEETPTGSHFDVLILGPFALYRDGQPLDVTSWQRKVQTLFRLLISAPDRRRSRDDIVDILWPDMSGDAGFRNLRVVLHMLRRGLGAGEPPPILTEWGWISLNPAHEWDVDLERFEKLATMSGDDIALLEQAAGYYRGEPLSEDRYDDWAMGVRLRAQRHWRDVCFRLARLHGAGGAPEVAVGWLDRILEVEPLDEEALRLLLASLGELDRRTEALRRYQQFAQRLKDELDLAPGRETQAIVAELRTQTERPSTATAEAVPIARIRPVPVIPRYELPAAGRLVGRESELGRILWTLPPMHEVAPRLVAVVGDAGTGKTRLLSEVAQRARRAGLLTLAGGCFRHEGRLLYGPIRDALADYVESQPEAVIRGQLDGLLGDLMRIVPELRLRTPGIQSGALGPGEDHRLLHFVMVTKALERIAQDTPLVLLLDDLQWADESTLQMLHFVVRQFSLNRMLIVGALTPEGSEPAVGTLIVDMVDMGWATSVRLGPLPVEDLGLVLSDRIRGRCADGLIAALHAESGGNPLRALHCLDTWQQQERLRQVNGVWQLASLNEGDVGEALA